MSPKNNSAESVTLKTVNMQIATKTGRAYDVVAKATRRYVRAHFPELQKQFAWPQKEKDNRDGNAYAPMTRDCADHIIARATSRASSDDAK